MILCFSLYILANLNKDFEVSQPGDDTISSLCFSPKANFLIASSWDNNIRCWEIQQTGQSVAKAMQSHTKPILDSCWHEDGAKVFTAGADNMAKMWDLQSNQATQVSQMFFIAYEYLYIYIFIVQ